MVKKDWECKLNNASAEINEWTHFVERELSG